MVNLIPMARAVWALMAGGNGVGCPESGRQSGRRASLESSAEEPGGIARCSCRDAAMSVRSMLIPLTWKFISTLASGQRQCSNENTGAVEVQLDSTGKPIDWEPTSIVTLHRNCPLFLPIFTFPLLPSPAFYRPIRGLHVLGRMPTPMPVSAPILPVAVASSKDLRATHHLASGALSGLTSAIILQPLDLLKTRLQQSYEGESRKRWVHTDLSRISEWSGDYSHRVGARGTSALSKPS